MVLDQHISKTEVAAPPEGEEDWLTHLRRNHDLFQSLVSTIKTLLPADKGDQFQLLAQQFLHGIDDNCAACRLKHGQVPAPPPPRDPRRNRFLLRLVVGKVSHLFAGPHACMPRSLIEGLDRYLKKAFGPMIYEELNSEADQLLYRLNCDDDKEMWQHIRDNPDWARFVDTVFLRILFRFENFPQGKKTFVTIVDTTMQEQSHFPLKDEHFSQIFEALFSSLYDHLSVEEQCLRWDFHFGDGTSRRVAAILELGLARYIKKRNSHLLGSGRVLRDDKHPQPQPAHSPHKK